MQAVEEVREPQNLANWQVFELKTKWAIPCMVSIVHILALLLITFQPHPKTPPKAIKRLLVHTVSLQSPQEAAPRQSQAPLQPQAIVEEVNQKPEPVAVQEEKLVVTPTPTPKPVKKVEKKQTPPKPKPKPQAKPTAKPKPQVKKESAPKAKPQPKKEPVASKSRSDDTKKKEAQKRKKEQEAKQQAMINEALSSLDSAGRIEGKRTTLAAISGKVSKSAPSQIAKLSSESLCTIETEDKENYSGGERTYYDELVSRLKLSLKLPEYGEVKLQVTVQRSGKVVQVTGVKSKSKKNSDYLQKALFKLHLPPFGQNFPGEKEHTFRLALSNELNY